MLYKFGHRETILRFAALVKSSLQLIYLAVRSKELEQYDRILRKVTKDTAQLLVLQDSVMEENV